MRLPSLGLLVAGAGFGMWSLKAFEVSPVYGWVNALRVAGVLLMLAGLAAMARGRSPNAFRAGVFTFLGAATWSLVHNATSEITLPGDLSTLFGFLGAAAASYGAAHWFEPEGDDLAAAWLAGGFALMACNPGTYLLLSLAQGTLLDGGWGYGTVTAFTGCVLFAANARRLVGIRRSDRSAAPSPRARDA